MADERCVSPGGDPRTPGTWLNREAAEALLRGESLEAVDADARDQAERLARTLGSLTSELPSSGAELPGEAAALAAFRTARSAAHDRRPAPGHRAHAADTGRRSRSHTSDAGLVRIGGRPDADTRRRALSRPLRFGLTAVLAAGMVGGVTLAATSGVLPTPFGGDEPGPAASVSAAVTPERPLISPSPNGLLGKPTPDGSTGGSATPRNTPTPGSSDKPDTRAGGWWWKQHAPSTCRDALGGKELAPNRKQALETAAGGLAPDRVWKYCKHVLAGTDATSRDGKKTGKGGGQNGAGGQGGQGDQNGQGGSGQGNGNGQGEQGGGQNSGGQGGDDDGNHIAPGGGGAVTPSTSTSVLPGRVLTSESPAPAPDPTYSAL
ncbi:hypothetical protein ACQEWB_29910 [Streptomyces sp. CA-249302]|uniref:hypothetical protein n=1 Tax=Streptomyces sp. CA-249302 TaxID=3240058 RepID=UPI003D8E1DDA